MAMTFGNRGGWSITKALDSWTFMNRMNASLSASLGRSITAHWLCLIYRISSASIITANIIRTMIVVVFALSGCPWCSLFCMYRIHWITSRCWTALSGRFPRVDEKWLLIARLYRWIWYGPALVSMSTWYCMYSLTVGPPMFALATARCAAS